MTFPDRGLLGAPALIDSRLLHLEGLGFKDKCLGFKGMGLGFKVQDLSLGIICRFQGLGSGSGFRAVRLSFGGARVQISNFLDFRCTCPSLKGSWNLNPSSTLCFTLNTPPLRTIWVVLNIMGGFQVYIILRHLVFKGTKMGP